MAIPISRRKAAAAFKAIVEQVGRGDVTEILLNWDDSELSEDGSKIFRYIGRDRQYSHGAMGGKVTVSKKEFIEWLVSEAPFDENVYGRGIRTEEDWAKAIESARDASGIHSGDPLPTDSQLSNLK